MECWQIDDFFYHRSAVLIDVYNSLVIIENKYYIDQISIIVT